MGLKTKNDSNFNDEHFQNFNKFWIKQFKLTIVSFIALIIALFRKVDHVEICVLITKIENGFAN